MLTAADFVRHAFPLITHHINKQQNRSSGTSIIHAWPRLSHLCNKAKYITPFLSKLNDRHMCALSPTPIIIFWNFPKQYSRKVLSKNSGDDVLET